MYNQYGQGPGVRAAEASLHLESCCLYSSVRGGGHLLLLLLLLVAIRATPRPARHVIEARTHWPATGTLRFNDQCVEQTDPST